MCGRAGRLTRLAAPPAHAAFGRYWTDTRCRSRCDAAATRATPRAALPSDSAADHPGKDGGTAHNEFSRRGEQRDGLIEGELAQVLDGCLVLSVIEFGPVAPRKLVELPRIVAVPLAQLRRRCNVLAPFIEMSPLLAEPARPQAIDKYPLARRGERLLVDARERDLMGNHDPILALPHNPGEALAIVRTARTVGRDVCDRVCDYIITLGS